MDKEKSPQYDTEDYWAPYFGRPLYTEGFWSRLFEEGDSQYRTEVISNVIPDDRIHRFVLHFLRSWRETLHRYILDEEISEEERVAVLRKQVENFAFFSRKKPFGLQWKMYSEPDDFLQQASLKVLKSHCTTLRENL